VLVKVNTNINTDVSEIEERVDLEDDIDLGINFTADMVLAIPFNTVVGSKIERVDAELSVFINSSVGLTAEINEQMSVDQDIEVGISTEIQNELGANVNASSQMSIDQTEALLNIDEDVDVSFGIEVREEWGITQDISVGLQIVPKNTAILQINVGQDVAFDKLEAESGINIDAEADVTQKHNEKIYASASLSIAAEIENEEEVNANANQFISFDLVEGDSGNLDQNNQVEIQVS
jgi:hypothetical protein